MIEELKAIQPKLRTIVVGRADASECAGADFFVPTFEPAKLLDCLKSLEPELSAAIEKHEEDLAKESR